MNYLDEIALDIYYAATPDPEPGGWYEDRLLYRTYAVLLLAKGVEVTDEDVHNAWAVWACEYADTHPSLVRFEQLAPHTQALDRPYTEAIRRVAADMIANGML